MVKSKPKIESLGLPQKAILREPFLRKRLDRKEIRPRNNGMPMYLFMYTRTLLTRKNLLCELNNRRENVKNITLNS